MAQRPSWTRQIKGNKEVRSLRHVAFSKQELQYYYWMERENMSDILSDELMQRKRVLILKDRVMQGDDNSFTTSTVF